MTTAAFVPRATFPRHISLPRSYFLGHHRSGLREMQRQLASIDLVIECRDYRIPITSRNPLLEDSILGKQRLILYTKHDLGSRNRPADRKREAVVRSWHTPTPVLFSDFRAPRSVLQVLDFAKEKVRDMDSLTGARMMVIGMPNVGKSSLLNALRKGGAQGKAKVAQTGAQPGVTRKVGNEVRVAGDAKSGDGIYLVDTPGVFIPFVPEPESMLKLALCGSVKDTIIAPHILADFLLFVLNREDPGLYAEYCAPTNEVDVLLEATARRIGRLQKGGVPDTESAAIWLVQRWRTGHLGRFVLDHVDEEALKRQVEGEKMAVMSLNAARKAARETTKAARAAAAAAG